MISINFLINDIPCQHKNLLRYMKIAIKSVCRISEIKSYKYFFFSFITIRQKMSIIVSKKLDFKILILFLYATLFINKIEISKYLMKHIIHWRVE